MDTEGTVFYMRGLVKCWMLPRNVSSIYLFIFSRRSGETATAFKKIEFPVVLLAIRWKMDTKCATQEVQWENSLHRFIVFRQRSFHPANARFTILCWEGREGGGVGRESEACEWRW